MTRYDLFGIGIFEATFLLFLGLKLGKVIDWSWWYVFAPLWMPILSMLIIAGFVLLFYFIWRLIGK